MVSGWLFCIMFMVSVLKEMNLFCGIRRIWVMVKIRMMDSVKSV